jgi:hypothetical protein
MKLNEEWNWKKFNQKKLKKINSNKKIMIKLDKSK